MVKVHEIPADVWSYFEYDNKGNCTVQQEPGGTSYFEYTSANLVKSIKYGDGTMNYFYYDALQRRYAAQDTYGLAYFTWDTNGMDLLQKRDAGGEVLADIVHGYSSVPGIGNVAAIRIDGEVYYLVFDHRGSVVAILNSSGEKIASRNYNAFGEVINETGDWCKIPFGFQSNWLELKDSGGKYLLSKTRIYDTEDGRFLQRDLKDGLTGNYTYGKNNPVNKVDPTGKPDTPASGGALTYTVGENDNGLWAVARRVYGVANNALVERLAEANNLEIVDGQVVIRPGQVLKVPPKDTTASNEADSQNSTSKPENPTDTKTQPKKSCTWGEIKRERGPRAEVWSQETNCEITEESKKALAEMVNLDVGEFDLWCPPSEKKVKNGHIVVTVPNTVLFSFGDYHTVGGGLAAGCMIFPYEANLIERWASGYKVVKANRKLRNILNALTNPNVTAFYYYGHAAVDQAGLLPEYGGEKGNNNGIVPGVRRRTFRLSYMFLHACNQALYFTNGWDRDVARAGTFIAYDYEASGFSVFVPGKRMR